MTYASYETSTQSAAPVELFRFVRGDKCWNYTSADEDAVYLGETYLARTISRGSFERNEEAVSAQVEVRVDRELALVSQFLDGSVPEPVYLWIFRLHRDQPDVITMFKGRVANATIQLEEIVLNCQSPLGSDEKAIPRERIMRTCPHALYGNRCRVDPTAYDVATTISGTGGDANQYTVASDGGNPDGWFAAGVMVVDATGQRGFIQEHTGNTIRLLQAIPGLGVSDAVTLYAGCDRTVETCRDKFNNVPEFGGFPLHPERNPFVQLSMENEEN